MQVCEANVFRVGKQREIEGVLTWINDVPKDVSTVSILYREMVWCPFIESSHGPPSIGLRSISQD